MKSVIIALAYIAGFVTLGGLLIHAGHWIAGLFTVLILAFGVRVKG